MLKHFKLILTPEEQRTKKAKLAKMTDKQLAMQAISAALIFSVVYTLGQITIVKKGHDNTVADVIIYFVIGGTIFAVLWFMLMRRQRDKARKMEK